jgi:hypothetical protein
MINKQGVEVAVDVALKEMRIKEDANSIDDFQHEVAIMRCGDYGGEEMRRRAARGDDNI